MHSLPDIHDLAGLDALRAEVDLWQPAVAAVARAHGLPHDSLVDLGGGNLVVGAGNEHVIKLTPPVFAHELEAESDALSRISGALPIDTPQLCAVGMRDGWSYIVLTRLRGRTLRDCWGEVPSLERLEILRALGAWLAALHALPVPREGALAVSWPTFVLAQTSLCGARQARLGLPPNLIAGIPDCLDGANLASASRLAMLHADLTDQNVLIDKLDGSWRVSGIIDFGDAQTGAPLYDMAAPALLIARGDRALLGALLDGYGIPAADRNERLRLELTALAVLHRFNDMTRYLEWTDPPPATLEEMGPVMFPLSPMAG